MQNDNGGPSTSTADKESSEESTSDKSTQTVNRRIVVGTWNVRSLEGKVAKIISEIEKVDAEVVVLTETKKKISVEDSSTEAKSKKRDSGTGTKSKKANSCSTKSKNSTGDLSTGITRNESARDSSTGTERNDNTKDSSNPKKEYFGDYTHIYSGVREGRAQAGVSILFKTYSCLLYDWEAVSDRIITAKMNIRGQKFIIIGVYGLSENASLDRKYDFNVEFTNELIKAGSLRRENYELIILGDFNSKVGISTSSAVGEFGDDEISDNGGRLVQVCEEFGLKIQNTFFEHEDVHKYTRYAKPSLIDFFITRDEANLKVHDVMACKWLECETDHVFVKAIVSIPSEEDTKTENSETRGRTEKSKGGGSLSQLEILEMVYNWSLGSKSGQ